MTRATAVFLLLVGSGCVSVAKVTTLSEPGCHDRVATALATVLRNEGETPDAADRLAASTADALRAIDLGPRPFLVAAPSGVDYSFFVEKKGASCLLRLYGRQKGFVSYTNNISYIATEPLAPCACAE
jgi:stage V sporulation protein SpoVS